MLLLLRALGNELALLLNATTNISYVALMVGNVKVVVVSVVAPSLCVTLLPDSA